MDLIGRALRFLPEFRGKQRLVRSVWKSAIESKRDVVVNGKFGCNYLLPNILENVGFDIYINGIYEPDTLEILNKLLPKSGIFLDIGGNIGSIAIPLCKQRPDIKVISIEAAPWLFKYLERNVIESELNNIELMNFAVYDKDETYISFYSPADKFGKGSMAPVFTNEAVQVKTRTIDSIIAEKGICKVDVIKVDVEGFESFVFKGASELLRQEDAPTIYFEFVDWAESRANGVAAGTAQEILLEFGYKLFRVIGSETESLMAPLTNGACNIVAKKNSKNLEFK